MNNLEAQIVRIVSGRANQKRYVTFHALVRFFRRKGIAYNTVATTIDRLLVSKMTTVPTDDGRFGLYCVARRGF